MHLNSRMNILYSLYLLVNCNTVAQWWFFYYFTYLTQENWWRLLHSYITPIEGWAAQITASDEMFSVLKVICCSKNSKILGIHFLGPHAGEVMQGFAVALRYNVSTIVLSLYSTICLINITFSIINIVVVWPMINCVHLLVFTQQVQRRLSNWT